ncbi:MAG: hypothetical protein JXR62_05545 [Bacilli bacterium]|nr:hypothetical protein [Bacilli bacterium]
MKKLKSAYINYIQPDGSTAGIKLNTFKGIDAQNSYKIGYVRHIPNSVNYVIGLIAYWSNRYNKPADSAIVTDHRMSKAIGCSKSHASYILTQIKDLFNLEFTRQKYQGGARTIQLNKQFIDFLKIYSEEDYQAYIQEHNITDDKLLYALRQIYLYRIWEVADSQLKPEQRQSKQDFIDEMRNHHHHVATANKSVDARLMNVEKGSKYLTELETNQLTKVRQASTLGKLAHYMFKVLIKLEQKISAIIYHKEAKAEENANNQPYIDGNYTPGENSARSWATSAAQKIPEEPNLTPRDYAEVLITWNNMIQDQSIPEVKELTPGRIQSIDDIVKTYGKEKLLETIFKVKQLDHNPKYQYKMKFDRFIQVDTFINVLELSSPEVNSDDWFESYHQNMTSAHSNRVIDISTIPQFDSVKGAIKWIREQ